jgi:hypothetical protein
MKLQPIVLPVSFALVSGVALGQTANPAPQPASHKPVVPAVATTIPPTGVHMTAEIGAFKIKRGSEAPDYGCLEISFKGTVLVSGLKGTAVPSNGAFLDFSQPQYKKDVYFSKGIGKLVVTGQFEGIQFFGQHVNAHYRGDGVIQLYGEFDKDLNTGLFWYDTRPEPKQYWSTNGITITPSPYTPQGGTSPAIKIKSVSGKS